MLTATPTSIRPAPLTLTTASALDLYSCSGLRRAENVLTYRPLGEGRANPDGASLAADLVAYTSGTVRISPCRWTRSRYLPACRRASCVPF